MEAAPKLEFSSECTLIGTHLSPKPTPIHCHEKTQHTNAAWKDADGVEDVGASEAFSFRVLGAFRGQIRLVHFDWAPDSSSSTPISGR